MAYLQRKALADPVKKYVCSNFHKYSSKLPVGTNKKSLIWLGTRSYPFWKLNYDVSRNSITQYYSAHIEIPWTLLYDSTSPLRINDSILFSVNWFRVKFIYYLFFMRISLFSHPFVRTTEVFSGAHVRIHRRLGYRRDRRMIFTGTCVMNGRWIILVSPVNVHRSVRVWNTVD